jgi:hypothetical protein
MHQMKTLTSSTAVRTTITLPLDVYEFVKTYASANAIKLSEAIANFARQAKDSSQPQNQIGMTKEGELWVFDLSKAKRVPKGKPVSLEQMNAWRDEL